MTTLSEPTVVPHPHHDDGNTNDGQYHSQGYLCTCGETRAAGECGVARVPARLLGCECASLQAREERIGGIIEDLHRSESEHRRVVIQRDLRSKRGTQLARGGT
jgi:hypothetical protein